MALAQGQPGEDWFQGPDGGWLPPDRKPKPGGATGTTAGASGSAPGSTTPGGSSPLPLSSPSPVTAPGSGLSTATPSATQASPTVGGGMFDIPQAPEQSGATPPVSSALAPPRTVTVNGQTFTIPSPPIINPTPSTGTAPSANAATLNYRPEDPMLGVVREQLLGLMGRANTPPSLTDPTLKPAADAYGVAQQRARQGFQNESAEALSARGYGSSGAADQALAQSFERMGENIGEFNAGLLTEEQGARRADLQSALGMANQLGMFTEKTALERDLATLDVQTKTNLANLDSQLRMAGLTVQERLGIMDAELKKYGIDLQGNMGLLETVLKNEFNYAQLQVQAGIANLDASVKMQLSQLDAQLRREGLSTQERLAALDAEVRKYGIQTSGDLGALDVALRRELGIGSLNLGLLTTLLQNQQFNDRLGWDMASWAGDKNSNFMNWYSGAGGG